MRSFLTLSFLLNFGLKLSRLLLAILIVFHLPGYNIKDLTVHGNILIMIIFTCLAKFVFSPFERTKLTAQFMKCALLGYATHQKGYLCYDPSIHRIHFPRNVLFVEYQYIFPQRYSLPKTPPHRYLTS
eukprot:TRINITY_DN41045_c0_g1_i2.p1 TRINITY_DN41045_c0_g1~~TRINITY_DN41045_c0_g1_i2.p1  ORF type:complete len:128 (+),score=3.20 TRINITY_DN41045_c0_g1_i2:168-551(+)